MIPKVKDDANDELFRALGKYRLPFSNLESLALFAILFFIRWVSQHEEAKKATLNVGDIQSLQILPKELRWLTWRALRGIKLQGFIEHELPQALSKATSGPFSYCFQSILSVFGHLHIKDNKLLDNVMDFLETILQEDNEDREETSRLFEEIILSFFKGVRRTEFYTPLPIVELMVEMASPQAGERIYDPCFGLGGLLVACIQHIKEKAQVLPSPQRNDLRSQSICGGEIIPSIYIIGLVRLVLAGVDNPSLELGNTLERSRARDNISQFDCILAVPPWGVSYPETSSQFPIRGRYSESQFLQHIMASLCEGGRAVVALPEGILFRGGPDQKIRQRLIDSFDVEGVISLIKGSFTPYTGIKTSLLVFRRHKPRGTVRFLEVSLWNPSSDRQSSSNQAQDIVRRFRSDQLEPDTWETSVDALADRGWELLAKKLGDEKLDQPLKDLKDAYPNIPVYELGSIARLFSGLSYPNECTIEKPDSGISVVGIIRVADLMERGIRKLSLFLPQGNSPNKQWVQRLINGDLLLSTHGSIGKVLLINSDLAGNVASKNMAIIRPSKGLLPAYLEALLKSESYQDWLKGHAHGSTIQYLPIRVLSRLLIPTPELHFQHDVVRVLNNRGGDALRTLVQLLRHGGKDSLLDLKESTSSLRSLLRDTSDIGEENRLLLLEKCANNVNTQWLRFRSVHEVDPHSDDELAKYFFALNRATEKLHRLSRVPLGSSRYAILENARFELQNAKRALRGASSPAVNESIELIHQIERLINAEIEDTLRNIIIIATLEPSYVVTGKDSEIVLHLRNQSELPLRNIEIITQPNIGRFNSAYFKEQSEVHGPLTLNAQVSSGQFSFVVVWRGGRLDGKPIEGEIPLSIEVRSSKEAIYIVELGPSPYIVGGPVDRADMFFGRREILDTIKRQLSTTRRSNVVLLEGNRRSGKSSILLHLEKENILPDWVVVNYSFQGAEGDDSRVGVPTKEVFRSLARMVGEAVYKVGITPCFPGQPPLDPDRPFQTQFPEVLSKVFSTDHPFETFKFFIESMLEAIKPRRLLLMLDEFDKLQEGIESGVTSPQVPENFRYLLHTYSDLGAILTGSRRLKHLRQKYWSALFGLGFRIGVSELSEDDARELVTRPVEGRLYYVPEARDHLIQRCALQPFLIQSLCNRVFEYTFKTKERSITISAVDEATKEMVKDNEHLHTLWDYAETYRRRLILALCERLADGSDPITIPLLETKLEEFGIVIPRRERIGGDIEFLRELELISLDARSGLTEYRIAIPLMGEWIHHHIDFEDLIRSAITEGRERSV